MFDFDDDERPVVSREHFMLGPPYAFDPDNLGAGVPLLEELRRLREDLDSLDEVANELLDALADADLEHSAEEAVMRGLKLLDVPTHSLGARMENLVHDFRKLVRFIRNVGVYDWDTIETMFRPQSKSKPRRRRKGVARAG